MRDSRRQNLAVSAREGDSRVSEELVGRQLIPRRDETARRTRGAREAAPGRAQPVAQLCARSVHLRALVGEASERRPRLALGRVEHVELVFELRA